MKVGEFEGKVIKRTKDYFWVQMGEDYIEKFGVGPSMNGTIMASRHPEPPPKIVEGLKRYIVHARGDIYHVEAISPEAARGTFTSETIHKLFPENLYFENPKEVLVEEEKET